MGRGKNRRKESKISALEKERVSLSRYNEYTFVKFLQWQQFNRYSQRFQNISRVINFARLIPTSTAEVERSFQLINLISVKLRKCLGQENLGHCMRISNYPHTLSDADCKDIYRIWLSAEETKNGSRKVAAYVKDT